MNPRAKEAGFQIMNYWSFCFDYEHIDRKQNYELGSERTKLWHRNYTGNRDQGECESLLKIEHAISQIHRLKKLSRVLSFFPEDCLELLPPQWSLGPQPRIDLMNLAC